MKIAILHYHLNRGGVSRVIENQLGALQASLPAGETCRVAIIYGGRADGWPDDLAARFENIELTLHVLPALDYNDRLPADPETLAAQLHRQLEDITFAPHEALLHIHNHSLGKNAAFPGAISRLAAAGYRMLLQVHDFAEDFRPRNYRLLAEAFGVENVQAAQYPHASHIHYAALNRRDETILAAAGIPGQQLHWLPNPVPVPGTLPDRTAARAKLAECCGIARTANYLLYPVRGIRRKNLGELLLWSALVEEETHVAVTLAPLNPTERPFYDRWQLLAKEWELPCHFDTGGPGQLTFAENLAAADLIVTTSVAEGFGMVFLEAWLAGRALAGRDLPEITADFRDEGIRLDALYARIDVPLEWVGEDGFRSAVRAAFDRILSAYGQPPIEDDEFERGLQGKFAGGCVDFADLDEALQERVIRHLIAVPSARDELLAANPRLAQSVTGPTTVGVRHIDHNRQLIERQYSAAAIGERLRGVYQSLLASPQGNISAAVDEPILQRFLDLRRFRLIRT